MVDPTRRAKRSRAAAVPRKSSPYSSGSGSRASAAQSRISAISTRNLWSAGGGSTRRPMSISWRCRNFCRDRRAARSASPLGCHARAISGRSRRGAASRCRRRSRSSCSAMASARSAARCTVMIAAVAVVAQAVLSMMRALAAAVMVLALPSSWGQIAAIVLGGLIGLMLLHGAVPDEHLSLPHPVSRTAAIAALALFFAMLIGLPLLSAVVPNHALQLFDAFYRAGSLVFGGGHVALPLLQASVVAGLGRQRCFPRRLWRGAGGTRPVVHVLRLSRNGDASGAQRMGGSDALPRRHVSSRLPARHRSITDLGRVAPPVFGAGDASRRPWLDCCSRRSTVRSGHRRSPIPAISRSEPPPSCCCSRGRRRPGWSSYSAPSAARCLCTSRSVGEPTAEKINPPAPGRTIRAGDRRPCSWPIAAPWRWRDRSHARPSCASCAGAGNPPREIR
jgi:chromate transport protein ChrA